VRSCEVIVEGEGLNRGWVDTGEEFLRTVLVGFGFCVRLRCGNSLPDLQAVAGQPASQIGEGLS
jgi:hypothetical protein